MPPRITSNLLFNRVPFRYSERFVIPVPRCRRSLSLASSFTELCTKPSSTYQIYISKTYDPFLNLSIEHFLLQKTPTDSTILFLYVNDPCVVIGRNQNPWLEANLRLLAKHLALSSPSILTGKDEQKHLQPIQLVRRRSGGGTVFHDHGNINYSVICPTSDFTRDKHAEMVVRAIRHDNPRARVNERHDIVLDQGCVLPSELQPDPADMHATAYSTGSGEHPPLKVSGSAYKLTRNRSLHHGTCLLSSPNLAFISQCLRSPAKPFMKARGVESVRSPISNVYPAKQTDYGMRFQRNVLESFAELYGLDRDCISSFRQDEMDTHLQHGDNWVSGYLTADLANVREIQCGLKELRSPEWIYGQTPQFTLSTHPTEEDDRGRPTVASELSEPIHVHIQARAGVINWAKIRFSTHSDDVQGEAEAIDKVLKGSIIHEIHSFEHLFRRLRGGFSPSKLSGLSKWLDRMFGKI